MQNDENHILPRITVYACILCTVRMCLVSVCNLLLRAKHDWVYAYLIPSFVFCSFFGYAKPIEKY